MSEIRHRLIMLKPMRPGVSGYARVQSERGQTLLQVHARGLSVSGVSVFWYAGGGEAVKLGAVRVNAHSDASLTADAPRDSLAPDRLQALIVLSDEPEPFPLLIGVCAEQSAGSLMDAKNAALALCDRLSRSRRERMRRERQTESGQATDRHMSDGGHGSAKGGREAVANTDGKPANKNGAHGARGLAGADGGRRAENRADAIGELPREIFLPAIDPLPYVTAAMREGNGASKKADAPDGGPSSADGGAPAGARGVPSSAERGAPPADRLRPLIWPRGFERLRPHFEKGLPRALFDLPGWRFVQAKGASGLWIGIWAADGRVRQVAYAHSGAVPGKSDLYRPARGLDGQVYQVLWQRV